MNLIFFMSNVFGVHVYYIHILKFETVVSDALNIIWHLYVLLFYFIGYLDVLKVFLYAII